MDFIAFAEIRELIFFFLFRLWELFAFHMFSPSSAVSCLARYTLLNFHREWYEKAVKSCKEIKNTKLST